MDHEGGFRPVRFTLMRQMYLRGRIGRPPALTLRNGSKFHAVLGFNQYSIHFVFYQSRTYIHTLVKAWPYHIITGIAIIQLQLRVSEGVIYLVPRLFSLIVSNDIRLRIKQFNYPTRTSSYHSPVCRK